MAILVDPQGVKCWRLFLFNTLVWNLFFWLGALLLYFDMVLGVLYVRGRLKRGEGPRVTGGCGRVGIGVGCVCELGPQSLWFLHVLSVSPGLESIRSVRLYSGQPNTLLSLLLWIANTTGTTPRRDLAVARRSPARRATCPAGWGGMLSLYCTFKNYISVFIIWVHWIEVDSSARSRISSRKCQRLTKIQ